MTLSEQHRKLLRDAAISDAVIDGSGAESVVDLNGKSGINFLWTGPKRSSTQFRPDSPALGEPKYRFAAGEKNFMNIIRDTGAGPLLIVEGTKQTLTAATWAPADFSVIGLAGCTLWHRHEWSMADGRDVTVAFDGDAATNLDVYNQALKFGAELKAEGASSVRYLQIPLDSPDDKAGLDDYLAAEDEDDRDSVMRRLLRRAAVKPADSKPAAKSQGAGKNNRSAPVMPETGGRQIIAVNGDLKEVVDNVLGALRSKWDGHHLFNYGEAITGVEGATTVPVEGGGFLRLLAETCYLAVHHPATQRGPERFEPGGRIDKHTHEAVLASAREFTSLERVVRAPFVRPDGTVCTTPGYDAETKTLMVPDEGLGTVVVPLEPSAHTLSTAVDFVMNDWLGDLPFPSDKDKAHALALIITPFVRGMFELAPLAVVSGLQMGVGKYLFADCVAILATGKAAVPMPYTTRNEEETRKQITAAFRGGAELFCFDEAHEIEGATLARALTSVTYSDRILGRSEMAEFPNRVTWMALGNQVKVEGDVSRRVYWIELKPTGANPQDRDASNFRHPDLRSWTHENRTRLVEAVLTIIRAWFVAGKPLASRGATLGSFEGWDRTVGGIVTHAGLSGFLTDVVAKRSETDFESAFWTAHIVWLAGEFQDEAFYCNQVQAAALRSPQDYEAPPSMEDPSEKSYTRKLGMRYAAKADRWYGGKRLVKYVTGIKGRQMWRIDDGSGCTPSPNDDAITNRAEPAGPPLARAMDSNRTYSSMSYTPNNSYGGGYRTAASPAAPATIKETADGLVAFDLETRSVTEMHSHPDFVRIGAATGLSVTPRIDDVVTHLNQAETITGHNIIGFDLMALAKWHGADYEKLAEKSFDTLIALKQLDPPTARGMPNGYYKLDTAAQRLGVTGKTDDIKALAKKYGGFDRIPLDDVAYREYLEGDVTASEAVAASLYPEAVKDPYIAREHRVSAIMGRMSLNGFRVDEELLWDRYEYGQGRLEVMREHLHTQYGFPKDGAAPQRTTKGKAAFHAALLDLGLPEAWLEAKWPKNADGTLSLSKDVLQDMRGIFQEHLPAAVEIVDTILSMNGVRSIYGNTLDWLTRGRVHPQIHPEQASGRWSVKDPGLTVFGKRGGKVVERAVLLADPGELLVAFDADQVDMRALAAESQDRAYMDLFIPKNPGDKVDPHSDIAALIGLSREDSKPIGHGWNYGMGIDGQVRNGVDRDKAAQFDQGMRERFPRLVAWKDEVRELGAAVGTLENAFGRRMRVNPERAYTQAPALLGQGGTRDILAEGLLRLPKEILPMLRVVVHDEIVLSIPKDSIEDVSRAVLDAMTFEHRGVPITWGQSKAAVRWSECY